MTSDEKNLLDIFKARGFFKQCTSGKDVQSLFNCGDVTAYIGFDPTAPSLHAGSLVPIMALMHLSRAGHRSIAVVGGGTGLVGDPSGKTEQRKMLTRQDLRVNFKSIKKQLGKFLDFSSGKALAVDNADWLDDLNYIEFLRDIGKHFSVNKMLSFEAYKQRLQKGLSFLEFNYQLLQAYDFSVLFEKYDCKLQMGGDDQWGNIVAGTDLVRRLHGKPAYGLTFPLLETSSGAKMGKTASGAVWLDANLTSPYDYYQYWINTDDRDVARFLKLFTFLPMEEIIELEKLEGKDIGQAKKILAFHATSICHGKEAAIKAEKGANAAFGGQGDFADIPTTEISRVKLADGMRAAQIFVETGLCASKGQATKLFKGGGAKIGKRKLKDHTDELLADDFENKEVILWAGRKKIHRLILK